MANIRSQKKRNRQNEKRRVRNKSVRTELKTRVKNAREAVVAGAELAPRHAVSVTSSAMAAPVAAPLLGIGRA